MTAAAARQQAPPGVGALDASLRERLASRFGETKLYGGEELTSVAWGLAARAHQLFGS